MHNSIKLNNKRKDSLRQPTSTKKNTLNGQHDYALHQIINSLSNCDSHNKLPLWDSNCKIKHNNPYNNRQGQSIASTVKPVGLKKQSKQNQNSRVVEPQSKSGQKTGGMSELGRSIKIQKRIVLVTPRNSIHKAQHQNVLFPSVPPVEIQYISQIQNIPLIHSVNPLNNSVSLASSVPLVRQVSQLQDIKARFESSNKKNLDLSSENERLKNQLKIKQVQISNINLQHYEREIARLHGDCQTYQLKNIQIQHKYQLLKSQKKQLELTNETKTNQIKQFMLRAEKERMETAQAKAKLAEKENTYESLLGQLKSINSELSQSVGSLTSRNQYLESTSRQAGCQNVALRQQLQAAISRNSESERNYLKAKKELQSTIINKERNWLERESTYKLQQQQNQVALNKLKCELQQSKKDYAFCLQKQKEQSQIIVVGQQLLHKQQIIMEKNQQIRQLRLMLQDKQQTIQQLSRQFLSTYSQGQYQTLEDRYQQLEASLVATTKHYQAKLLTLNKQNKVLRQNKLAQSSQTNAVIPQSYNDLLKMQIQQSGKWKNQLIRANEQSSALREQIQELKQKQKSCLNEIQILAKKLQSVGKNSRIELQVNEQKCRNEIQSVRRKLGTTETRLAYKTAENKQKDDFIKNVIMGRSSAAQLPFIVKELERLFLERDRIQLNDI